MRKFSVSLAGRVGNFSLPTNSPLIPLYEAVVNSLHAIEERRQVDSLFKDAKVIIEIVRSKQVPLFDTPTLSPVESFIITDNGIGFNEKNMQSFLESDSTHKAKIGGKGVGRFSWLKALSSVSVNSVFKDNGAFVKRAFVFSLSQPQIEDDLIRYENANDFSTTITFGSYLPTYQKALPKQLSNIAMRVIEHCLTYFLDDNCPEIIIKDGVDSYILNKLFNEKFNTEENMLEFKSKEEIFSLLNVKVTDEFFKNNQLYLCANNRLVEAKNLEKFIVDLDKQFFEKNGFGYVGIVTGAYLDKHVDMNRLSFNIPDKGTNLISEISLEEIMTTSCLHIEDYLRDYLLPIAKEKSERIEKYVTTEAPQYRHLIRYMPEEMKKIKPVLNDDALDDELYNIKRKFDKGAKVKQNKLLNFFNEHFNSIEEYESYFKEQIREISDANSAVLAEYVKRRRFIIEMLKQGLRRKDDGKFNKEKYMHNLIYPMKATSDETDYETHNLWLIDEKLSYCNFISSDMPFNNDPNQERTDLLILDNPIAVSNSTNNGNIFDTIIIFELKRPMRDNYTKSDNPIEQLYGYVQKICDGKARDYYHRPINVNTSTKFYLYAICDITNSLKSFINAHGFTPTPDAMGYYSFNKNYNAYFEILSYDKILSDASKRNRVLFDKLGI